MFKVGTRDIGAGKPCFLVAEIGMNHNGDVDLAETMIAAAAESGADAVKFQFFIAEHFVTADAMVYGDDKDDVPSRQVDMLKPYELQLDEWRRLQKFSESRGIIFFGTPLDSPSVDLVRELDTPLVKIASCDCNNSLLIRQVAELNKPTILSTGMSTIGEISTAVDEFSGHGDGTLALMQCVSSYPAALADANVRTIPHLAGIFGLPVGFSDHCKENASAFAAAALGAVIIEKHFTSDNDLPGVDQNMSLNPEEFKNLATTVRGIEQALGQPHKGVLNSEQAARENARRGLVAARDIEKGETVTADMIAAKRPASGISPNLIDSVIGLKANGTIKQDQRIGWEDLA